MNRPPIHSRSMRALIQQSFCELGISPLIVAATSEDLLIREGRPVARTYRVGGLMAMWMMDIGLVQFYSEEGELLRTYTVMDEPATVRRAA